MSAKTAWWRRLLCAIGFHSMRGDWCDDGKGNSGAYLGCRYCPHCTEDWL